MTLGGSTGVSGVYPRFGLCLADFAGLMRNASAVRRIVLLDSDLLNR